MADAPAKDEKKEAAPKKPLNIGLILVLVNTLALAGVGGLLYYTRVVFKRPPITEDAEREKLEADAKKAKAPVGGTKAIVKLEPITANLEPTILGERVAGGPPPAMKLHYAQMTIHLEIVDAGYEDAVREQQTRFLDALLSYLGKASPDELNTVQGRYLLRTKIAAIVNDLLAGGKATTQVVTNVFFSDFMVQ